MGRAGERLCVHALKLSLRHGGEPARQLDCPPQGTSLGLGCWVVVALFNTELMTTPHIAAAVSLLLTLAAGWYSWHRCKAEPRRLTNAVWIGITLALLLITGLFMGAVTVMGAAFVIVAGLAPVLVFGLVVLLLWNGVVMWRRESHSLGNMLSLLSALGVIAAMALSMWMVLSRHALMPVAMWIALALTWVAAMLMGFLAYSWLYQRMVRSCNPDFVITLGAGLAAGKVTPLLDGRGGR